MTRIVVTGAAGLVGQNLIARLKSDSGLRIVGIDKHHANTRALRRLHPEIEVIEADLSVAGPWVTAFQEADAVIQLHAQIGGLDWREFEANNILATEKVLAAMAAAQSPPSPLPITSRSGPGAARMPFRSGTVAPGLGRGCKRP